MNSVQALIHQTELEIALIEAISDTLASLSLLQAQGIDVDLSRDINRLTTALELLTLPYRE